MASLVDKPRVLVVDDRADNLLAMRAVLSPLDVDIVDAQSGEDALREVLEGDFAVILLDVQMPGMDGLETAECIRQRERSADIPIIFLTAVQTDMSQVFAAYEAGAVDYIPKPFDPVVLRSKVKVFADLDRQRRELVRSDELVRSAFDAAPAGMALCALDGRMLRVNPELCRLAGNGADVLIGAPVEILLRADDRAALVERMRAIADGAPYGEGWEAKVLDENDMSVPVAIRLAPVRDMHGEVLQLLVQIQDERDRRIAETLQRALLPERLPSVPGLSLAAHISPGGGGTQVGGDWYDAIALPGGRLGVVVGDVAGRGVEAAARMGELRSVARAYALEGHGPVELVERMNGYHAALGADLMTTLLYAVVEIDTGQLRVVNAGHPPPLLVTEDGGSHLIEGSGPPLGVLDTWRYEERIAALAPGDVVLLYTDGLIERRGERLDDGLARLSEAAEAIGGDVVRLCEHIVTAMDAGGADDDVTLLAVRGEPVLGPVAQLKLAPDAVSLASLRRVLRRWLSEVGAQEDEITQIVMAANEAWQNALEHGTGFARTTVDVELSFADGTVSMHVQDAGRRDRAPADPDRGRGIDLMRALMDEVELDLAAHGSGVTLRRTLRDAPREAELRSRRWARASAPTR